MKNSRFLFLIPLIVILLVIIATYLPLLRGYNFQRHDRIQSSYIGKQKEDFREKYGKEPLWFSSMFSGAPDPISTRFSGEYLSEFSYFLRKYLTTPIATHLIAALGVFLGLILISKKYWLASLCAICYSISGFNVISIIAGHDLKLVAIAYAPFIILGGYHIFRGKFNWGCIMYLFGLSLQLGSRHYQIVYYTVFGLLFFGFFELLFLILKKSDKRGFIKKFIAVFVLSIVSVLPNIGKVWYTMEYTPFSMRGGTELVSDKDTDKAIEKSSGLSMDYAFKGWSYKIQESLNLFVPNLYGGASTEKFDKKSETYSFLRKNNALNNINYLPTYWGGMRFTAGPNYLGATFIVLFIFSLFFLTFQSRLWILTSFLFFLILTWGDNFFINVFLFKYLPVYNKFRTPSMAVTAMSLFMSISIGKGFYNFFKFEDSKLRDEKIKYATLTTGGLFLSVIIFWISSDFLSQRELEANIPNQLLDALATDRKKMLSKDFLRTLLFAAGVIIGIYYYTKNKLSEKYLMIFLVIISTVDLYSFNARYLNKEGVFVRNRKKVKANFTPTPVDQFILKDTSSFRVFDMSTSPFNDARASFFHNSIGGYSALKMQRYQDLINKYISKNNENVLDLLNTKYLITSDPRRPVVTRSSALGPVWLVSTVKPVKSANEEIDALATINPKNTAVVDTTKFKPEKNSFILDSTSYIQQVSTNTQKIVYKAELSANSLAVFSEIYYPKGWEVTVDGKVVNYFRANYILRALELPAGEHEIIFEYKPKAYFLGNKISFIGSSFVIILLSVFVFIQIRKKEQNF